MIEEPKNNQLIGLIKAIKCSKKWGECLSIAKFVRDNV